MSFVVVTLIVTILLVGSPSAQAQATVVDQSTFQQQLASSTWALTEGMDSSLTFTENGNVSEATGAFITPGSALAVWNMSILFNDGTATVTAHETQYPTQFYWAISTPMGSLGPVESAMFGITYQALDPENITINDIAVNGGAPLSSTVFADQNNPFGGLSVNDGGTPITSITYDMSVYVSNPNEPFTETSPTMLSTVMVPAEATSVPEPGTFGPAALLLVSFIAMKFKRK